MNKIKIYLTKKDIEDLRSAKDFICENPGKPITINRLATERGIYRSKLTRAFRQLYGRTIYCFLLETRMSLAKKLLIEESLPIKSIASQCGYRTVQSFSRVFRKYYSFPPSRFQRKNMVHS